jgi:hypothetical protein
MRAPFPASLALTFALLCAPALGQSEPLDASIPDASVGEGGADRDNPEGEDGVGRTPTSCRSNTDCERGFACDGNQCTFVGYRKAETSGCQAGVAALFAPLALLALVRLRRR